MTVEQEILAAYDSNINDVFSIHEISKRVGKAYPYIHKKVGGLIDQGILKRTQLGRSHLCSVNLTNKEAVMLLALNEIKKHDDLPPRIKETAQKVEGAKNGYHLHSIVYDASKDELLVATTSDELKETLDDKRLTITHPDTLKNRLLEHEDFYANHVVIAGHEHFFALLTSPEIERRYHPLL